MELLVTHGANASALDKDGHTAADIASDAGYDDIKQVLVDAMYELTDRLTYYLCGRRPDHKNGVNYLIPAKQDK